MRILAHHAQRPSFPCSVCGSVPVLVDGLRGPRHRRGEVEADGPLRPAPGWRWGSEGRGDPRRDARLRHLLQGFAGQGVGGPERRGEEGVQRAAQAAGAQVVRAQPEEDAQLRRGVRERDPQGGRGAGQDQGQEQEEREGRAPGDRLQAGGAGGSVAGPGHRHRGGEHGGQLPGPVHQDHQERWLPRAHQEDEGQAGEGRRLSARPRGPPATELRRCGGEGGASRAPWRG